MLKYRKNWKEIKYKNLVPIQKECFNNKIKLIKLDQENIQETKWKYKILKIWDLDKLTKLVVILDQRQIEIVLDKVKVKRFHLLNTTLLIMIYQIKSKNKEISYKILRKSMYKKLHFNLVIQDFLIINKRLKMIVNLQSSIIDNNK